MRIWELDLSDGNKYVDNNGYCWYSDGSDLVLIDLEDGRFVIYIDRFYDSLAEVLELTFEVIK